MSTAMLLPTDPPPLRRFTVDEYRQMAEAGILTENDRVELLEGWIISKMTLNPPHNGAMDLLERAVGVLVPAGWLMRSQRSISTADSEPEPDLAVVMGNVRSFGSRNPRPNEVGLVVEVANSTLATDRGIKARLYARAEIPVYWIINLKDRQLELLTEPSGPTESPQFGSREVLGGDDEVPFVLEGKELGRIAVRDLLP